MRPGVDAEESPASGLLCTFAPTPAWRPAPTKARYAINPSWVANHAADSQPLSGAPGGRRSTCEQCCARRFMEAVQKTPLQKMDKLSSRLDNVILVKREDRQPVHSFKLRGAYAMMSSLTAEQKSHGVITASAGKPCPGRGVFRIAAGR